MGTLTADCPRLEEHCIHKLPSSCRLTSTPNCCACADERQHTTTYRTYIDGVGFVQRGTRWQGYCWFCKVFWDARVSAAGLSSSQTKIPDDPDQAEFCERWFEWHQGYRIERKPDGSEARVELRGEPLKEADPGHLPRTWDEIANGTVPVLESDSRRQRDQPAAEEAGPQTSLEEALDQLLEDASDAASENDEVYEINQDVSQQLRNTSQTSDAGPRRRQSHSTMIPQAGQSRLDDAYAEAQRAVEAAQRARDRAEARLSNSDQELAVLRERLRRIRRQQITAGNFARVFGTREDVNSEDYVSPITSMFVRQHEWARRNAERERELQQMRDALHSVADVQVPQSAGQASDPPPAQNRNTHDPDGSTTISLRHIGDSHNFIPATTTTSASTRQSELENLAAAVRGISLPHTDTPNLPNTPLYEQVHARIEAIRARLREHPQPLPWTPITRPRVDPALTEPVFAGLDGDERPEAKSDEAMQFKLECKICLQQIADTACLPCGHLSMCEWCADQWVPTKEGDKTRPREKGVRCPICRARVRSRVKIYPS